MVERGGKEVGGVGSNVGRKITGVSALGAGMGRNELSILGVEEGG